MMPSSSTGSSMMNSPITKKVNASKGKAMMNNPKKKAIKSALGALSSGANFRNQ